MTRIYSIEGNIGSGKSTFVRMLKNHFSSASNCDNLKIGFLEEPVNQWESITDKHGKTVIEAFYADPDRYAFSFQMMAYISRLSILRQIIKENYDIIFTERCIFTDKNVFAQMLYDDNKINEIDFKIYNKWFDEFITEFKQFNFIYIKTNADIALSRVTKRARTGENIPLEYLEKCHLYHENWMKQYTDKIIIDGNTDSTIEPEIISQWIKTVIEEISTYSLKFDGASKGNPGPCGTGYVVYRNNEPLSEGSKFVSDSNTNNFAEYSALIDGLELCISLNIKKITIMGNSELVIKQVLKEYRIESPNLLPLSDKGSLFLYTTYPVPHGPGLPFDAPSNLREYVDISSITVLIH